MDSCDVAGLARDSYLYNSRRWFFSHDWWEFSDAWSDVYFFTSDFSPHNYPDSYLLQKRWNTALELGLAEEEVILILMKNFLVLSVIFCLSIYAIPWEYQTHTETTLIKEDTKDYREYFIYIAVLIIIMVLASSVRQIQKYNQK